MGNDAQGPEVDIGRFRLRLATGELLDPRGQPKPPRPKPALVLSVLASLPGQMIDKRTQMDAVRGDVHVTEDSPTKCIGDIRAALEEDAPLPETVPRRGYRLRAVPVSPPGASRLSLHIDGPDDLTGDPRWQRIARVPGGEITRVLSNDPWLSVSQGPGPRDCMFSLSGELLADGERVRVPLRLTERETGKILWTYRDDFRRPTFSS